MSRRNKIIVGIICLITLITFGGITYAYFSRGDVIGNENEKVVTLTADYGEIIVTYPDDNVIKMANTDLPINEQGLNKTSELKFEIENTGNISQNVTIKWKDIINTFCQYESNGACTDIDSDTYVGDEISYNLYSCEDDYESNCSSIGSGSAPLTGDKNKLHEEEKVELPANSKTNYVLEISIENKEAAQDYNQGKNFSGTIDVQLHKEESYEFEGIAKEGETAISEATIRVYSEVKETTTDANGYYKIEGIKEGRHTLELEISEEVQRSSIKIIPSEQELIRKVQDIYEIRTNKTSQIKITTDANEVQVGEIDTYKIGIKVENGTSEKEEIEYGLHESETTISASEGYNLSSAELTCDEGIEGELTNGILTITNATTDGECTIDIPIKKYSFSASSNSSSHGTTTASTSSVSHGGSATISVSAKSGYAYSSYSCSGEYESASKSGSTITVSGIKSAVSCTVSYRSISYTISVNVTNGSASPSSLTYYSGSSVTSTITATDSCYNVSSATVSCDSGITGSISGDKLTISSATRSGTCSVALTKNDSKYSITVTSNNTDLGTATASIGTGIGCGGSGFISLTPKNGVYSSISCSGSYTEHWLYEGTLPGYYGIEIDGIKSNISCTVYFTKSS